MKHTIICGCIVNRDDEILLVKEGKEKAYGQWNIPTGKIEKGESPKDCAIREVKEESGITVCPDSVVGVYTKPGKTSDVVLAVIFEANIKGRDEIKPEDDDILTAQFVNRDKIPELSLRSSHILPAIRDWENEQKISLSKFNTFRQH